MLGFNFKTHKVDRMYDYEVITRDFNYQMGYWEVPLNEAADNLEKFFINLTSDLQPKTNYHFIIHINNKETLDFEDYFSLFAAFGYTMANKGKPNNQGYLKVVDSIRDKVNCTDFSMLKILNNEFDLGVIQLSIFDTEGAVTEWVQK
jgi:hypothetical protein